MNIFKYLAPLLVTPSLTFAQSSLAQDSKPNLNQQLTMYAKPAVVRIVGFCKGSYIWHPSGEQDPVTTVKIDKDFIGTGFLINPNGYIVTSADVMEFKKDCKQSLRRNIKDNIKERYGQDLSDGYIDNPNKGTFEEQFDNYYVYLPNSLNSSLSSKNKKPFEIKTSGRDQGESSKINKDVAVIKVSLTKAPILKLGDSSSVEIQDHVITVGYPKSADFELDEILTQESYFEASVQDGRISNPNKEIEGGYPVFQIDIRTAEGSAGSTLINDSGEVVGMLTYKKTYNEKKEVVPIAIPSSTIQEFIRQSGTINEEGETDKLYREGLENFWKGNFHEARAKFVQVRGIFPFHSEVDRLINDIDLIEADWWANPWKNPAYIFLFALLVGGGVVGAVAYFLLRQRQQFATATAGDREGSTNANSSYNSAYNSSYNSAYNSSYKRNGKGKKCFMEMEYKGQIQRFQLSRSEHRLGRDPAWSDLDIPISWEVISRRHGILKKEGDDYRIFDGDRQTPSRNGLWVNDDFRVDPQDGYLLHNGDRLKIGQDQNDQVLITYFNPNQKDDGGSANPKTTMAN